MLPNLPYYIPLCFILVTIVTYWFLIAAARKNNSDRTIFILSGIIVVWLAVQALLAKNYFYTVTDNFPPRFVLLVLPMLLLILFLFLTKGGKRFIDSLSLEVLTLLHVVRVFVEIVLLWLYMYKCIPQLMTFEGRNFDVLAGLTAPLVYYFGFVKHKLGNTFMLVWNIVCLFLLLNIVINAVLSAPFPFQQFGFDQPNIAVLHFPFVWLPCFIVPVVLFSHLVLIRRLLKHEMPV
jgi:hypothetical protein